MTTNPTQSPTQSTGPSTGLPTQPCPLCHGPARDLTPYHHNVVCRPCEKNATGRDGTPVDLYATSLSGGFVAFIRDTNQQHTHTQVTTERIVLINGIECTASDGRFGGIIIQPLHRER